MIGTKNPIEFLKTGLIGGALIACLSTAAFAGGLKDMPVAPKPAKKCEMSANVALGTDYVFRGVSQTDEDPTIQGGFDLTCGIFYTGIWASNVDFDSDTNIEIDYYAGITPSFKGFDFDFGVIYYTYPTENSALDVFELKAGVSKDIYKGLKLGTTGYFNIDDEVYTYEISAEKSFAQFGGFFTPTISALVGFVDTQGTGDYTYWNAGLGLGFMEKYTLDLRYHDSDMETPTSDERFVATLSASF